MSYEHVVCSFRIKQQRHVGNWGVTVSPIYFQSRSPKDNCTNFFIYYFLGKFLRKIRHNSTHLFAKEIFWRPFARSIIVKGKKILSWDKNGRLFTLMFQNYHNFLTFKALKSLSEGEDSLVLNLNCIFFIENIWMYLEDA